MYCYNCLSKDTEEEQVIRYFMGDGPNPCFVENLPAQVCQVCGLSGFPTESSAALELVRLGNARPVGCRTVPVFDLNNPFAQPEKPDKSRPLSKAVGE